MSRTQTIRCIGELLAVYSSVDVHVCRPVKSSRVLTSTTFFSFPDSILAYHILIVLPYAIHPSYRQPYPSTDMSCLRFRLSVLTCLSCNVCFPSLPLYSFLFLTSTDRKAKSWWNCCLTLQFGLRSIFFFSLYQGQCRNILQLTSLFWDIFSFISAWCSTRHNQFINLYWKY